MDYDLFFEVPNAEMCLEGDKAKLFIATDKFWLTSYICMAHAIAIVCQETSNVLIKYEYKIFGSLLSLVKVFVYIFAIFVI